MELVLEIKNTKFKKALDKIGCLFGKLGHNLTNVLMCLQMGKMYMYKKSPCIYGYKYVE